MEKILITGGDSFIGRAIQGAYKSSDIKTVGSENGGVTNYQYLLEEITAFEPDIIFHLAAAGSKKGNYTDWDIFRVNVEGTFNLLRAASYVDYEHLMVFSTSSVYGDVFNPMREDMRLNPRFPYAASKAAAEMLALNESSYNDRPVSIIRPFSVYGEGMQDTKLIPVLIDKIRNGEEIDLVDGVHDFIHIDDLISGLRIVKNNPRHFQGKAVNIGTGMQTSNREVVDIVSELLELNPIVRNIYELDGHVHSQLDSRMWIANTRALNNFGWFPQVELKEGVKRML